MDTLSAFVRGEANRGREQMVFDWDEAARRIVAAGTKSARAGLYSDWEWTGGAILRDGKPVPREETYVYLASTWARPELDRGNGPEDCYKMQSETPGWNAETYWPDSARAILTGEAS